MKILIAFTTSPGHLNPLLSVGRILVKRGHEVLVQTGKAMVYRNRARELAEEFAQHDTEAKLLDLLEACVEPAMEA
jgi:UDP:flavonoid glycosyltransferase YjiC (YdhE family)